jgi:inhibitor of KinA
LKNHPLAGMIEAVPAFSSITIHFDVARVRSAGPAGTTAFEILRNELKQLLKEGIPLQHPEKRIIEVPVCYDPSFGHDLATMSEVTGIGVEEIIQIHTSITYRVYMLGFLPGFCYMGEVDERIALPRKQHPQHVEAGSIGIAGKQTGIYPLSSPGGWNIIGKTNLSLFNPNANEMVFFKAGDEVKFISISRDEFTRN